MGRKIQHTILTVISLIFYICIVVVIPLGKNVLFWIAFVSGIFSILLNISTINIAYGEGEVVKSRFQNWNIINVGYMIIFAQISIGILFLAIGTYISVWVVFPIELFLILLGIINLMLVDTSAEYDFEKNLPISENEEVVLAEGEEIENPTKIRNDIEFKNIESLNTKMSLLIKKNYHHQFNYVLDVMYELVKSSDPTIYRELEKTEKELHRVLENIEVLLNRDDTENALTCCTIFNRLLEERNVKCKRIKEEEMRKDEQEQEELEKERLIEKEKMRKELLRNEILKSELIDDGISTRKHNNQSLEHEELNRQNQLVSGFSTKRPERQKPLSTEPLTKEQLLKTLSNPPKKAVSSYSIPQDTDRIQPPNREELLDLLSSTPRTPMNKKSMKKESSVKNDIIKNLSNPPPKRPEILPPDFMKVPKVEEFEKEDPLLGFTRKHTEEDRPIRKLLKPVPRPAKAEEPVPEPVPEPIKVPVPQVSEGMLEGGVGEKLNTESIEKEQLIYEILKNKPRKEKSDKAPGQTEEQLKEYILLLREERLREEILKQEMERNR